MHSGERKMLYDILDDDESIMSLVGGNFRKDTDRLLYHKGIAVATTKRVIFVDKGLFGSTEVMELPYPTIEGVTYSTGLFRGGVEVKGIGGASYRLEDMFEKDSMRVFADCVREHMNRPTTPTITPVANVTQESIPDQIEKFHGLFEKGVITQEEFEAKKKQLLGL